MTTVEILLAAGVYFVIPISGLLYFVHLRDRMIQSGIQKPPVIELFLVFAIYGILLLTILSGLFWEFSLFSFLGSVFMALPAPIGMAFISVRLRMTGSVSKYHLALQKAALYYFLAFPIGLFILYNFAKR